jgi:hypothetical protein
MKFQATIDDSIRKLTQLRELLTDPEIAAYVRRILKEQDDAVVQRAETAAVMPRSTRLRRRRKEKRGTLVRAAFNVVKNSSDLVSAKKVASVLESEGYTFEAKDKCVAVSKALRTLARDQKIKQVRTGSNPKAPILYGPMNSSLFPVQERTM